MANSVVVMNGANGSHQEDPVRLSRKQRAVVSYIEHNPKFAAFATAGELGARVNVHPSTVVRLAQLLGYDGFPEFQAAIRHTYLCSLDAVSLNPPHTPGRFADIVTSSLDQDMRNLATTRASLDSKTMQQVARLIQAAPVSLAIGGGSHGGLALIFSHLCRFMGLPVDAEIRGGISLAARLSQIEPGHVVAALHPSQTRPAARRAAAEQRRERLVIDAALEPEHPSAGPGPRARRLTRALVVVLAAPGDRVGVVPAGLRRSSELADRQHTPQSHEAVDHPPAPRRGCHCVRGGASVL